MCWVREGDMKRNIGVLVLSCGVSIVAAAVLHGAAEGPPPWAYGFAWPAGATAVPAAPSAPAAPAAQDDGTLRHLPGSSSAGFTLTQIRDGFGPADWYPGDHPAMPDVVAHGRRPDVRACS